MPSNVLQPWIVDRLTALNIRSSIFSFFTRVSSAFNCWIAVKLRYNGYWFTGFTRIYWLYYESTEKLCICCVTLRERMCMHAAFYGIQKLTDFFTVVFLILVEQPSYRNFVLYVEWHACAWMLPSYTSFTQITREYLLADYCSFLNRCALCTATC